MKDSYPVRFRRPPTSQPLPEPVQGDTSEGISALHRFLGVDDDTFVLIVGWLLAGLRDRGPYPVLVLCGEQGSAKTTRAKMLRSLIDPASPPTRAMPKDERDALIAAKYQHVLLFDNLSSVPVWFSDALCRIATGAGFATRRLHTDAEETVFEASRPAILTGISNIASRGDLADRSLIVRLSPISDLTRRTEAAVMAEFESQRPLILGALLDGISVGLGQLSSVKLERLPRMADFCEWAVACESAFWPSGTFVRCYEDALASSTADVLDDAPIWPALLRFLEKEDKFDGTASDLLERLNEEWRNEREPRGWPHTGAVLGRQFVRLAPTMRRLGYIVEQTRTSRVNCWHMESP